MKKVMSHKPSLRPFARRMSVPVRHFTTALSHPFHAHRRLDIERDSYLAHHNLSKGKAKFDVDVEVVEVEVQVEIQVADYTVDEVAERGGVCSWEAPKKPTKLKRVARKAKAFFRVRRRS
jgi:hypothetical protein